LFECGKMVSLKELFNNPLKDTYEHKSDRIKYPWNNLYEFKENINTSYMNDNTQSYVLPVIDHDIFTNYVEEEDLERKETINDSLMYMDNKYHSDHKNSANDIKFSLQPGNIMYMDNKYQSDEFLPDDTETAEQQSEEYDYNKYLSRKKMNILKEHKNRLVASDRNNKNSFAVSFSKFLNKLTCCACSCKSTNKPDM